MSDISSCRAEDGSGDLQLVKQRPCCYSAKENLLAVTADVRWTLDKAMLLQALKLTANDAEEKVEEAWLVSPAVVIACAGDHTSRWRLRLDMSTDEDIGLGFGDYRLDSAGKEVDQWADAKIAIGDCAKDSATKSDEGGLRVYVGGRAWENFMPRRDLVKKCCEDDEGDQLVITASITIYHSHAKDYQYLAEQAAIVGELQGPGDFFIVRCQGQDIHVPKKLLALRSPVFAKMLEVDMQEAKTGVLVIDDFAFDTVSSMIKFIHIGQLLEGMDVVELLKIADKYEIERPKKLCSGRLTEKLTPDNAGEMLVLGDMHAAAELKQAAMDLICSDLSAVMATDGWQAHVASNNSLVNEVLATVAAKQSAAEGGGD